MLYLGRAWDTTDLDEINKIRTKREEGKRAFAAMTTTART